MLKGFWGKFVTQVLAHKIIAIVVAILIVGGVTTGVMISQSGDKVPANAQLAKKETPAVSSNSTAPTVTGVENGKTYKEEVTISFNKGTATLNNKDFTSGTKIRTNGEYTLVVKLDDKHTTTIHFTINTVAPTVTGVENGKTYNEEVTISFDKGTATLNGAAFNNKTKVNANGKHTLVVTDDAGNITTIVFTLNTDAPTVEGVVENKAYNKPVTPKFEKGTATLNNKTFVSGTTISADGQYTLVVKLNDKVSTTVHFTIDTAAPVVSGVTQNGTYANATISFNKGTATLNGVTFKSGTQVSTSGNYTLIVKDDAGNTKTISFTIDATPPVVSGVKNNETYTSSPTISFNKGTATLNGVTITSGTKVGKNGDYTLIVTDAVKNVTKITFKLNIPVVTINVYAAASLTDAMNDIIASFNKNGNNNNIVPTYGASGTLQTSIQNDNRADIFISAAKSNMDILENAGLIENSTRDNLLSNKLTLICRKGMESIIDSYTDLTKSSVKKIAIGTPASVPAGKYAQQSLTNLGLWDTLNNAGKFVYGSNVRTVLDYVDNGDADAGFVYKTDAALLSSKYTIMDMPSQSYEPVLYPAAIIKNKNTDAVKEFFNYLNSSTANRIFANYGFTVK